MLPESDIYLNIMCQVVELIYMYKEEEEKKKLYTSFI